MSETKDRRRRIVPSVNTVRKKQPPPSIKPDISTAAKSPEIVKDSNTNASSSGDSKVQVFVLSPAILKQMGINIGNLQKGNSDDDIIKQAKKDHPKSKNDNSKESIITDRNSESVKKTLYNKLTGKKNNKTNLPSIKSFDSNLSGSSDSPARQSIAISSENNVISKEMLKTYNLPENADFRKPTSPDILNKVNSSNMETVSYVTSSMIMSPGEDISNYIAGYSNLPQESIPPAVSGNVTNRSNTQNCTSALDNSSMEKLSISNYNTINENDYLQTTARLAGNTSDLNISLDARTNKKMDVEQKDVFSTDQKGNSIDNFNTDGVGLGIIGDVFPVHYSPNVIAQQFYNIQINPNVLVSDQIEFINSETPQICIDIGQSTSHQDDSTFTGIQNVPFSREIEDNSFQENDGGINISESNDESFDYIIEDVNSDEIEKVDFMNVDLDLLQKETNESLENQSSYLCPIEVDTGLPSTNSSDCKHHMASCLPESQGLPPFEIISPISTIKKYLYSENTGSPNSNSIHRNIDYFLKSIDQNIEFTQPSNSYIENNYNFVPSDEIKISKDFIIDEVSNREETPSVTEHNELVVINDENNISENSKLQNITPMIIKPPNTTKFPNLKNTKKTVAEVPVNLNNTFKKKHVRVYAKCSPKSVTKHSSLSKAIQSSLLKEDGSYLNVSEHGPKEVSDSLSLQTIILRTKDDSEKKVNLLNIENPLLKNNACDISQSCRSSANSTFLSTNCVERNEEELRRIEKNKISSKRDEIVEDNIEPSGIPQRAEPLHKIIDYLKQFHTLKAVKGSGSKPGVDLEVKKNCSKILKEVQEKEKGDKIMHGVEKPGGSGSVNTLSHDMMVQRSNLCNSTINLRTKTLINDNNYIHINTSSKKLKPSTKSKDDVTNKSNVLSCRESLNSVLDHPGSSACSTFETEIFSYNNIADESVMDVEVNNTNKCNLFEDSHDTTLPRACDSYKNAGKISPETEENIKINLKSQGECDLYAAPQKHELEDQYLNKSAKEIKTYSRIKYKKNETELIDLPNTHNFNIHLMENVKINEIKINNVLYGMQNDNEVQQQLASTPKINTYSLAGESGIRNEIVIDDKNASEDTELIHNDNFTTGHLEKIHSNYSQDRYKLVDADVFSRAIDESLETLPQLTSPTRKDNKDIEASLTLSSSDTFSSVIPKKRFSRMDGFIKESQSNTLKEFRNSVKSEITSVAVEKIQYDKNDIKNSPRDDIQKRITKASRKCFDTFITDNQNIIEVLENDKNVGKHEKEISNIVEQFVNDTPKVLENHILSFDPNSCADNGVSEIISVDEIEKCDIVESTCESDIKVDHGVISDQSQIVEYDDCSLTLLDSQNTVTLHNMELSNNQIQENSSHKNIEIPHVTNNSTTVIESNEIGFKCTLNEENKAHQQMNNSVIMSGDVESKITKLEEKIVCRPPKKIIIERVRIDLNISEANRINNATLPVSCHIPINRMVASHSELLPNTGYCNGTNNVRDCVTSDHDTFSKKDFTMMEVVLQDDNEIIWNQERIDSTPEQAIPSKNKNYYSNLINYSNQTKDIISDQRKKSIISDMGTLNMKMEDYTINQSNVVSNLGKECLIPDVNLYTEDIGMNTDDINKSRIESNLTKECQISNINALNRNTEDINMNTQDINQTSVVADLRKANVDVNTLNMNTEDINMNTDYIIQSTAVMMNEYKIPDVNTINIENIHHLSVSNLERECQIPDVNTLNMNAEDINMSIDQSGDLSTNDQISISNVNDVKVKESRRKTKAIPSKIKSYLKMKASKTNMRVKRIHSIVEESTTEGRKAGMDQFLCNENATISKNISVLYSNVKTEDNICPKSQHSNEYFRSSTEDVKMYNLGDIVQMNSEDSVDDSKKRTYNSLNCTSTNEPPLNTCHITQSNVVNGVSVHITAGEKFTPIENVTNEINIIDSCTENTRLANTMDKENTEQSVRDGHILVSNAFIDVSNTGSVKNCESATGVDVDFSDLQVENDDPGSVDSVNHDNCEQLYTSSENFGLVGDICESESILDTTVSSNITEESSVLSQNGNLEIELNITPSEFHQCSTSKDHILNDDSTKIVKSAHKRKRVPIKESKKEIKTVFSVNSNSDSVSEIIKDNFKNTVPIVLNNKLLSNRRESDDDCPLSVIKTKDQDPMIKKRGRPVKNTDTQVKKKGRPPKQLKTQRPSKPPKEKKLGKDAVTCAVCSLKVNKSEWLEHSLNVHKYLAWQEGETPLDIENEQVQIQALTRAKKKINLLCDKCGEYRASVVGYISHISMCQKTEEEINALRQPCPICKRVMLPQSLKVHLSTHSRTVKTVEAKEDIIESIPQALTDDTGGRKKRKAAETAGETFKKIKTEMEYVKEVKDFYKKPWCGRATGIILSMWKKQIAAGGDAVCNRCKHSEKTMETIINHYTTSCPLIPSKFFECKVCKFQCEKESDMCDHIKVNHISDLNENKDDSCSESNHSESDESESSGTDGSDMEELLKPVKKSRPKPISVQNEISIREEWKPSDPENKCYLPGFDFGYSFKYPRNVYRIWNAEFISTHYSKECLFPNMGCNVYRGLGAAEVEEFLPERKESCSMANSAVSSRDKIFHKTDVAWHKYKLFESNLTNGVQTFWCGGPVWALGWVPGDRKDCYLAVAPDRFMDSHFQEDVFYSHKGLIQIWNAGDLSDREKGCTNIATMVMAIAHNGGVVWDMSWCPSGCDDDCRDTSGLKGALRMGLLALACSDGRAYIYAIANPSSLPASESKAYITEPVAVLQLSREDVFTLGRSQYQATRVFWSREKGHNIIAVGYTSGVVAFYNVGNSSRLLQSRQGNTTVYLPFHSFQPQRTRITGLVLLPALKSFEGPMMCVTSNAGCSVWSGPSRLYWRRGQFSGAALAEQWPQVIAFTEELQPKSGGASTIPFRVSSGQTDKITMTESGVLRGCVIPWSGALLGLGLTGQLTARRHRTPFISRDRKSSIEAKNPTVLWYPEMIDLRKALNKTGDAQIKKTEKKDKNNPIEDFAKSFEEAAENYGILFVNKPKNNLCLEDRYSLSAWPLWESLSVAVPSGAERHNFNAVGGRAGQCRITYTPDCGTAFKNLSNSN